MPRRPSPWPERFWMTVAKSDGCWEWTAFRNQGGYGLAWDPRCQATRLAHRMSWELTYGAPPPKPLDVLHHCDHPACVRPDHLYLGTDKDNVRDMDARGRRRQARGEQFKTAKLKWGQAQMIRRIYADMEISTELLARHYGVSATLVREILRHEAWRGVE
jgi:hypothetical protein